MDINESVVGTTVSGYREVAAGDVDISEADFLMSIGAVPTKRKTSN